jgi:hypothetical protein
LEGKFMKIVLAEKVSPATLEVLKQEPGWNVVTADQIAKRGPGGLEVELADADALVVRSAVQVDAKLLEAAPKLRVIGRAGVGVDNIDTDAATHRGIVVMNTPGRQRGRRRGVDRGPDDRHGPSGTARERDHACSEVGEKVRCRAPSCAARLWAS